MYLEKRIRAKCAVDITYLGIPYLSKFLNFHGIVKSGCNDELVVSLTWRIKLKTTDMPNKLK